MAILKSGLLSLEIRLTAFTMGFEYEISFKWDGKPIINDAILKRDDKYWDSRSEGSFLAVADEIDGEFMIPLIKKTLKTNTPQSWDPTEDEIVVAIYPNLFFPFIEYNKEISYVSEELKQKVEERERIAKGKGKIADYYTIIFFVDVFNFKNATGFQGRGVSLHIDTSREELEKFCKELESEYRIFLKEHKVHEVLVEEYGEDYREEYGINLNLDDED